MCVDWEPGGLSGAGPEGHLRTWIRGKEGRHFSWEERKQRQALLDLALPRRSNHSTLPFSEPRTKTPGGPAPYPTEVTRQGRAVLPRGGASLRLRMHSWEESQGSSSHLKVTPGELLSTQGQVRVLDDLTEWEGQARFNTS